MYVHEPKFCTKHFVPRRYIAQTLSISINLSGNQLDAAHMVGGTDEDRRVDAQVLHYAQGDDDFVVGVFKPGGSFKF